MTAVVVIGAVVPLLFSGPDPVGTDQPELHLGSNELIVLVATVPTIFAISFGVAFLLLWLRRRD